MPAVVIFLKVVLYSTLAAACCIIACRLIFIKRLPAALCLFVILPVGQLLTLSSFSRDGWSIYWILGLLLSIGGSVLFLFYAIKEEKKAAAMEELMETQHRMQLEESHYESVKQRREELEEIRKEFCTKLQAISEFISSGEEGEARSSISEMAEKIHETIENTYCRIPVINAVLTQKSQQCKEAGIDMQVKLALPDNIEIDSIHLCSIFGNILDNAITACLKLKKEEKPVIQLYSAADGDYLFIKSTNSSDKPSYISLPGHGYGHRILSEIAKQYDGGFQSNYSNGVFTVMLSLAVVRS